MLSTVSIRCVQLIRSAASLDRALERAAVSLLRVRVQVEVEVGREKASTFVESRWAHFGWQKSHAKGNRELGTRQDLDGNLVRAQYSSHRQ